jgi:hypothetical protein
MMDAPAPTIATVTASTFLTPKLIATPTSLELGDRSCNCDPPASLVTSLSTSGDSKLHEIVELYF